MKQMITKKDCEFIIKKCREYTLLGNDEIETILNVAKTIQYFNSAADYEVFIDIKVHNEDKAVVIAESYSKKSIYQSSFLGDLIYRENEPAVFRTFDLGEETHDVIGISYEKTGNKVLTKQTVLPIFHGNFVVATLILEKALNTISSEPIKADITSSHNVDLTETMLSIIGFSCEDENMQIREGVLIFDETGQLVYFNKFAEAIYKECGYKSIESLHYDSLNFSSIHFEDLVCIGESDDSHKALDKIGKDEKVSIGNKYYRIRVVVTKHEPKEVVVFIDDISEIREYEKEVNKYLVTYQEIHHRIKNNLQTVASLLRLQRRGCKDQETKMILSESINRILSIAVTHDLLSKKNGDQASILEVLNLIKRNMIVSCEIPVDITVTGDDFHLDSDKSSVLALVVNELLQNSIEHAFLGRDHGKIEINTVSNGDIKVIEVKDNGVGYDQDLTGKDSLGMMIVKTYVREKLAGKLIIESGTEGTTTSFAFKL
ncbi:MAG: sensor histidine kinase [Clostridia bacterium]|nr:sensor histidine kinase [Clostridia bacterium]